MQKIELERCYCGAVPQMENFISLKFGFLGKGQMTAFRVVCSCCDEGRFNLRGSPTREKAAEHWNDIIKSWKEIIREESQKPAAGRGSIPTQRSRRFPALTGRSSMRKTLTPLRSWSSPAHSKITALWIRWRARST